MLASPGTVISANQTPGRSNYILVGVVKLIPLSKLTRLRQQHTLWPALRRS